MGGQFGFIVHPLDLSDIYSKFSFAKRLPKPMLQALMRHAPAIHVSHATGIETPHQRAEGWFVAVPLTAEQMIAMPTEVVLNKIIQAGRKAQQRGAKIVGLGAFTSVV